MTATLVTGIQKPAYRPGRPDFEKRDRAGRAPVDLADNKRVPGGRILTNPPEVIERTADRLVLREKTNLAAAVVSLFSVGFGVWAYASVVRGDSNELSGVLVAVCAASLLAVSVLSKTTITATKAPAILEVEFRIAGIQIRRREYAIQEISGVIESHGPAGPRGIDIELRGAVLEHITSTNYKSIYRQVAVLNDFISSVRRDLA